jgi:REP-associated tyrosine transposase
MICFIRSKMRDVMAPEPPVVVSDTRHPPRPVRRSLRLKAYDYAQAGAYFVTICTQDRTCLFGDIVDDHMQLNDAGYVLAETWARIPAQFSDVEIDAFVVMPNHVHGIIVLPDAGPPVGATLVVARNPDGARAAARAAPTLGDVVGAFKSAATVEYIRGAKTKAWPKFHRRLWQRNYYEHVIRNETALNRIRRYIDENPARWAFDDENPSRM